MLKIDGKDMTGENRYQDVYVKRNGKWSAVAAHKLFFLNSSFRHFPAVTQKRFIENCRKKLRS